MVSSALSKIKNAPLTRLHGKKNGLYGKTFVAGVCSFPHSTVVPNRWATGGF